MKYILFELRPSTVLLSVSEALIATFRVYYGKISEPVWSFGCQLWDINMDSGPVATFQVHEYLRPKVFFISSWAMVCSSSCSSPFSYNFCSNSKSSYQLCDLYENDSIFDKFECCLSGDGLRVATGSYRLDKHLKLFSTFEKKKIQDWHFSVTWDATIEVFSMNLCYQFVIALPTYFGH